MRSAFQRLALFAGSCATAGAIAAVWVYVSVPVAVVAAAGGTILTIIATVELRPTEEAEGEANAQAEGRSGRLRAVEKSQIERQARRSRETDE